MKSIKRALPFVFTGFMSAFMLYCTVADALFIVNLHLVNGPFSTQYSFAFMLFGVISIMCAGKFASWSLNYFRIWRNSK